MIEHPLEYASPCSCFRIFRADVGTRITGRQEMVWGSKIDIVKASHGLSL